MEFNLAPIVLFTPQKELLCNFLAELLDMDVIPAGDDILLSHELLKLRLVEKKMNKKLLQKSRIDFNLGSREELDQVLEKIEFLNYRNSTHCKSNLNNNNDTVIVVDPDGREWQFGLSAH